MSRTNIIRRVTSGTAICGVLSAGLGLPLIAWAQDTGGMLMELRLAERFVTRDRSSPVTAEDGVTTQLITDLAFNLSSETRTEAVTLAFGAGYRFYDGPTTDSVEGDFTSPTLALSYSQTAADANLSVGVTASQVDLADVSPLDVGDEGLTRDFSDLVDGGTRTQLGMDATLAIREDAPFGLTFGVSVDEITYDDLPEGSTLSNNTAVDLSTTARFDISQVLQATFGVQYGTTDIEDSGRLDRYGITAGAVLTQPTGAISVSLGASDGDGGAQTSLQLGRSFSLPQTTASFGLGIAQATTDTLFVTGSAKLEHDFGDDSPFGTLIASADRSVTLSGRSDEEVVTSLSVASSYALSPLASLRLSADLAQAEDTDTGDTVDIAQAGLSLRYDMTERWRATAGLSHDRRDPSDDEATISSTLSLGLSRSFDMRR